MEKRTIHKEIVDIKQGDEKIRDSHRFKEYYLFQRAGCSQTNFIATISHELKTPLALPISSLKLLEDTRVGELTNEQKELISSAQKRQSKMLKILSELVEYVAGGSRKYS